MLHTTIAGSLPKHSWLAEPEKLWAAWRVPPESLAQAQRDAVLVALKEQETAGIDVVTDGEQSRQHFVHGFLERLEGIDFGKRVTIGIRADRYQAEVPTVTGPIARKAPVHLDEVCWARANTQRKLKFTIPGPMTIVDTLADEHYRDRRRLAMEFARVINAEARELVALGLDVLQLDEPAFNVYMDDVRAWGIDALHRAIEGLPCKTAAHLLRLRDQGERRLEDDPRRRVAPVRADVPGARGQPDRSGLGRVRQLARPPRAPGSSEGEGRAGRRGRRRDGRDRNARGGRGDHPERLALRSARAPLRVHQLRDGAARPRRRPGQASGARRRRRVGPEGARRARVISSTRQ